MRILFLLLGLACIHFAALAGDLAETGDLAPSPDISYSYDPFAGNDPVTGMQRKKSSVQQKLMGKTILRQQQDNSALQAAQQIYQNQAARAAATAPTTIEIPAGTISGINSTLTVTTGQ